jgi:hypothetical protein
MKRERYCLEDLGVDARIILNNIKFILLIIHED